MTFPAPSPKSSEVLNKLDSFRVGLAEFVGQYSKALENPEATAVFREEFGGFIVREISNANNVEEYVHAIWDDFIDKVGHDPLNIKFTIILKLAEALPKKG